MRVHTKFIDYISDSKPRGDNVTQKPWYGLKMQRSKWFDLFSADDRIELLRGIWGIMSYLMRVTDDGESMDITTG